MLLLSASFLEELLDGLRSSTFQAEAMADLQAETMADPFSASP